MLSLSPRYDLFRFVLPKDFLPEEIYQKYYKILNQTPGVITSPIDYLNESIISLHIPGISDLVSEQQHHESNPIQRSNKGLGRINVEPNHNVSYATISNPLEKIEKEFRVTFRMNQGFYNYYMLYETVFHHICKHIGRSVDDVLYIELLNETGEITGRILFKQCHINGIDGLDFGYDKTTRETGTFDITFKFNNIDFEFLP